MGIILWIITSFLQSVWSTFWKKALDNSNISSWLFLLFWPLIWTIIVYFAIYFSGTSLSIFTKIWLLWLLVIAWIFDGLWQRVEAATLKKVKMSYILPYRSLDKLFIIILWFIFFYWKEWYTSIATFSIAIFTFIVTLVLSLDFKNLKLDKNITKYIFWKLITSISTLIVWLVLLEHTTLELFSFFVLVTLSFHIIVNYFQKNNFLTLFTQPKKFYKYRILWTLLGWSWFFLSFLIIEQSWVVIASLISFISIVFSILSMKVVLGDTPTKKQVILAFLVTLLIWIGFYFK